MVLSDLEQPMANLNIVDKEKKAYVQKFAEDVVEVEEESTVRACACTFNSHKRTKLLSYST